MAKNRVKKKRRFVSFLVVPDDYSEPLNFKISVNTLKALAVLAIILFVHSVVGVVFYYRYYVLDRENTALRQKNTELEKENSKIYALSKRSQEVDRILQKLRVSLGIEPGTFQEKMDLFNKKPAEVGVSPTRISKPEIETMVNGALPPPVQLTSFRAMKSPFQTIFENYPTYLPVDGIISKRFEESAVYQPLSRNRHVGIDIAAKKGSLVKAAGAGTIVYSGWTNDLGNLVIIYHGNGLFTYYAHNLRLLKNRGSVRKGEPIALLGSSGKTSTGPHLHFEIWRDGVPVNPENYIFSLRSHRQTGKKL